MDIISNEELDQRALQIAEECKGIHPMFSPFYTLSINYSAERSLAAFDLYEYLLQNDADPADLIGAIQEAVAHAGALSRYFWPSPGRKNNLQKLRVARGNKLREMYKITEESPLANRELRNTWEHFDEKLDTYLLSHTAGHFFPTPLINSHTLADDPVGKIFKLLDPDNDCLVLLGKKFFYAPIRKEVERIFSSRI